jgi:hypothetical protein
VRRLQLRLHSTFVAVSCSTTVSCFGRVSGGYSINSWNRFDVHTETDADGRYIFCRIPRGSGRIGAGDCHDAVFWCPVEVNGDTVLDTDLRPFRETCP